MNEIVSLLMTTTFLALGGLGIYLYSNKEEEQTGGEINENSEELEEIYPKEEIIETKNSKSKTKRNKRKNSISKKRYYTE